MLPRVIGLTGPTAGGKDLVAKQLKDKGYKVAVLSDRIREEMQLRGMPQEKFYDTKALQDLGDEMRTKYGNDVLLLRTLEKYYRDGKMLVINGIRHPDEIVSLTSFIDDSFVIAVIADRNTRAERARRRKRGGTSETDEEFEEHDVREFSGRRGSGEIQLQRCIELANVILENNGSKKELGVELKAVLSMISPEGYSIGPERD